MVTSARAVSAGSAAPVVESRQVVLRDGETVIVRGVKPEDRAGLRELFAGLSAQSWRLRFGATRTDADAAAYAAAQPGTVGVVAVRGGRVVGQGSYEQVAPGEAVVALIVSDELHRNGLGTILLEQLAKVARQEGIERFTSKVVPENHRLLEVLRRRGCPVTVRAERGTLVVETPTAVTQEALERFEHREELVAVAAVAHVLRPASVAVIGASRDRSSPGGALLGNVLAAGFTGQVYAVNPAAEQVAGVRAYPSIRAVPGPVELAVIAVPAPAVVPVARECAKHGVKALVVITAGFAETGAEGAERQSQLLEVCAQAGMRLVGPNCMGVLNTAPDVRLHATFAPVAPRRGRVGLVSQSGGLGLAAMALANELEIGLSVFVSIGNRADVSTNDILSYLEHEKDTNVALLYVESFGNPRKFARIARRVAASMPIVAVKSGRSAAGARASASHTGALVAASDVTVGALFRQAGVIRTDTLEELLDVGSLLAHFPVPAGPRVGIVANAGGLGILAVDACEPAGLVAPELSAGLQARLAAARPGAATANPVDLLAGAGAQDFQQAVRLLATSGEVDAVIAVAVGVLPDTATDPGLGLLELARQAPGGLPVVPVLVGDAASGRGVALFGAPERAVHALGHAWRYRAWRERPPGTVPALDGIDGDAAAALLADVLSAGGGWLDAGDVDRLLRCYGIPLVASQVVGTPAEAARAAVALGMPVALKARASTLVHKSDVGAVCLGLTTAAEVEQAGQEVLAAVRAAGHEPDGLLVQQMAAAGVELLAGVVHDPTFGPVIACGAGGTVTELLGDVAVRLTPLTDRDTADMLRELRTFPLLDGYRGTPPADVGAVESLLLRLSALADAHPEVAELDCNPVIASAQGATVVDARVRVEVPPGSPT